MRNFSIAILLLQFKSRNLLLSTFYFFFRLIDAQTSTLLFTFHSFNFSVFFPRKKQTNTRNWCHKLNFIIKFIFTISDTYAHGLNNGNYTIRCIIRNWALKRWHYFLPVKISQRAHLSVRKAKEKTKSLYLLRHYRKEKRCHRWALILALPRL